MSDFSMVNDEQLIGDGINAAESERLAELVSRYSGLVFSAARRFSTVADYEELVSDGLDALLNAVSHFDSSRGSFAAFASVCVNNRLKSTAEKALKRNSLLADESELDELEDTAPTPEELLITKENTAEMAQQMKKLLTPLEFRCLEGVILGAGYDEIAGKVGITRKSVDNAVHRARTKLRSVFPDY